MADEIAEIARAWYQDHGYFKALAEASTIVIRSGPVAQVIDIRFAPIDKGRSYRLGEIHWSGTTQFPEDELRQAMPLQSGEVFARDKIAQGLENLRALYSSRGYVNFTCIPNTTFDEDRLTASLNIEVDEGPEFRFRDLTVVGLDEERAQHWQDLWENRMRGRSFSKDDLEAFLQELFTPVDPHVDPLSVTQLHINEKTGTVDVSMTFYSKSVYEAMQSAYTHQ